MTLSAQRLAMEIDDLRRSQNAVILAHFYQRDEIQNLADEIGDSLKLAQVAAETTADVIMFCGVRFMAETAKILNQDKTVLLPDLDAGCSLVNDCPADKFAAFKADYPDHIVLCYVNSSPEVKALSDIIVTSANAEKIVRTIPPEQGIIFTPDRNLGRYLIRKTGREMVLWQADCEVHVAFSEQELLRVKQENPGVKVLAHPECIQEVLQHAEVVGSTSKLLQYSRESDDAALIVATEPGIIYQMQKSNPDRKYILAPAILDGRECACNVCPYMKLNTLEKIHAAFKTGQPEITLPSELMREAARPIKRMLELS
ncbi:MAG: quinolinate synthase NadA [Candidatus Delongbacteria bacterium]|nr:quinolinate synthase NadA [Candidatus Delongbacteria bacterium]